MSVDMGIREALNNRPKVVGGVALLLIAGVLSVVVVQLRGEGTRALEDAQAFYSVDDGKTWIAGPVTEVAPFEHQGQTAVRAYVFECDGGRFVNHLERYTPEARKAILDFRALSATSKTDPGPGPFQWASSEGREVKRPGSPNWVKISDAVAAAQVMALRPPEGMSGTPIEVNP